MRCRVNAMRTAAMIVSVGLAFGHGRVSAGQEGTRVVVEPEITDETPVNPGMGWVLYYYSHGPDHYGRKLKPSETLEEFPGISTVYMRIAWSYVEPEEDQYNWSILDAPAQRWIEKGKRIGLCITASESWKRWATPEWVKNDGAAGKEFRFQFASSKRKMWAPQWDDPVFLKHLGDLLEDMAERYDGNPNVDFIDIAYGLWGEGHTHFSWKPSRARHRAAAQKVIDLYCRHFPNTLLALSDDVDGPGAGPPYEIMDYARGKGVTMRDNSILVKSRWHHADMARAFWPKRPVILEHEHYGSSKKRGAWKADRLLQAVEAYHASYLSIHWWPREFLRKERPLIEKINRRLGYRLELRRISWPASVKIREPFTVKSTWANTGVAPCYPGGYMTLTLKDKKGGIVAVLTDARATMRELKTGPPGEVPEGTLESTLVLNSARNQMFGGMLPPRDGTCTVYVSVGRRDGTPRLALPLAGGDGHRRYRLGTITLEK